MVSNAPVRARIYVGDSSARRRVSTALIIGSSDGIGKALARRLLDEGSDVAGMSRSACDIAHDRYSHQIIDVRDPDYRVQIGALCDRIGALDVCVYCAGVGESLELDAIDREHSVFEVNLMGAVATVEVVVPRMVAAVRGHLIGLSSQADRFINRDAPSYSASKAGMSTYLESMALAVREQGVRITNVRFGFVDTKMAKSDVRPFMISPEKAARLVHRCMRKQPIRYTYPRRMAALMWLLRWGPRFRMWWS